MFESCHPDYQHEKADPTKGVGLLRVWGGDFDGAMPHPGVERTNIWWRVWRKVVAAPLRVFELDEQELRTASPDLV